VTPLILYIRLKIFEFFFFVFLFQRIHGGSIQFVCRLLLGLVVSYIILILSASLLGVESHHDFNRTIAHKSVGRLGIHTVTSYKNYLWYGISFGKFQIMFSYPGWVPSIGFLFGFSIPNYPRNSYDRNLLFECFSEVSFDIAINKNDFYPMLYI
jgi:hypothetical protein